jgi:hypothetical protein
MCAVAATLRFFDHGAGTEGTIAVMTDTEPRGSKRYAVKFNLNFDLDNPDAAGEPRTIYEMDTPIARQVADLLEVQHDLAFVQGACSMLLFLSIDYDEARLALARSLWSSAFIAYLRCFAGGSASGAEAGRREAHPRQRDRDSSGAEGRAGQARRALCQPDGDHQDRREVGEEEERFNGWTQITVAHWETNPRNALNLYRLAEGLLAVVTERLDKATPVLDKMAKEIGLDTIKTWPEVTYEQGDYDPVADRLS